MEEIVTPRQIKSRQTKDRIFEAAVKLVKEHGYEYLTVKNICNVAEISNGTFFHLFKCKDELLAYYLCEGYNNYMASFEECDFGDNFVDNIVEIYLSYARYCQQTGIEFISHYYNTGNKALCRSSIGNGSEPEYSAIYLKLLNELEKAKQQGYVKEDQTSLEIASEICITVKGVMFEWCLRDGHMDLLFYMKKMINIYLRSIVTQKYIETFS